MTAGHAGPARSDAALSLRGVRKAYGAVEAVRGLDLDVAPGEVVTVVGPSGCGKSTLLRLVAGLEHSDAGVVGVGGEVVDDGHRHRPPERRRVGMVFQDHALFPHLDVDRNVAFGLDGLPRAARAARVAESLELVGLPHLGSRLPHELSGGEQQRVALARALAPRPSVVLLDEPFSSLDENLRARVRAETLAALRRSRSAALLVTHDQTEALALGDRVAVVHAGRALQVGAPEEVYERPVSRFVATFLGEATFVPATVVDGQVRCELGPLPLDPPAGAGDGLEVMLRPHELRLAATTGLLGAPGHVTSVEYVGARTTHEVVLRSGRTVSVWTSGRERHPVGAAVTVTLAPDA
ncbi:ABC transporter ATP-binding protein, partial [Marmoricola sp. Leaf446]|uniref:ABC transporter ATP-binding protein n=1 Tax=Marmoricola sp. Leaf446 TaxID=1736379 RepID=UPI0009EA9D75